MILAIDCSANLGLVSLELPDGARLARLSDLPREHTRFLGDALAELIADSGRSWEDLTRVAVTIGPGSFTGLRVGLACAKGLVFGRDLPIAPLPSLALPVLAHPESARRACLVCRPARGAELWAARFAAGAAKPDWERLLDASALRAEAAAALEDDPPGLMLGTLPTTLAAEPDLPRVEAEPAAEAQLEALAQLARETEELVSGPELDRLLPRYLLAPATTKPRPAPRPGGST